MTEYKFCPKCGSETDKKAHNLLVCKSCTYNFYINPAPTNAVILENEAGEILLVKRKFEPMKGYLDLPGGFIEIGESMEDSTIREIKEELGIDIKDITYYKSYPDEYLFQEINVKTLGLTLTGKIEGSPKIVPSDDVEEAKFYKKTEIPLEDIAFESIRQALVDYLKLK